MMDEKLEKVARAAQLAIETMTDQVAPLAAGAHIGIMVMIDLMREDPSFEAKFQAALKRRLAHYPPAFDQASRIFATPDHDAVTTSPGTH